MLLTTLPRLRCPSTFDELPVCSGELTLTETTKKKASDIISGTLTCQLCGASYPILAGIAVVVSNVERYMLWHVKGISALVADSEIPQEYREAFQQAKSEIEITATEEDLESQRINALYCMNHFLSVRKSKANPWWRPQSNSFSAEIDHLVKKYWDHGPFAKIAEWTKGLKNQQIVELGCGVGGLAQVFAGTAQCYLGVDSAFASIALARHIYLGAPYALEIKFPQDLFTGPLTRKLEVPKIRSKGDLDFVVGELENLPVKDSQFDLSIALNAIDMIPDPRQLPKIQFDLLRSGGIAIQSCPYIWHKAVSENLRKILPKKIRSSSAAVEFLYEKSGFKIFKKVEHLPWLFLKHFRQIELYSVHLFAARKSK